MALDNILYVSSVMGGKYMKQKKMPDMTPICDKCGKVAPIDEEMSTEQWTVYRLKEPCECGGEFKPRFLLEQKRNSADV